MSTRFPNDEQYRPSVLDRLLDDEPHHQSEVPPTPAQQLRDLRNAVRRDLEGLLNTRWRCSVWPPDLDNLEASLVNYGIPDFTSASMDAANDPDILLKSIEAAIRLFEPRLHNVRIEQINKGDKVDRTFQFRIHALLKVEPLTDSIRFDSTLEPVTGAFQISGAGR